MRRIKPTRLSLKNLGHFNMACGLLLCTASAYAFDLKVTILNATSNSGSIRAALYEEKTGWLKNGKPVQVQAAAPQAGAAELIFHDLPAGKYAVTAFHDENGNNELDFNAMGANTEPIAFSRDARGRMGPARFEDASFELNADTVISMSLH